MTAVLYVLLITLIQIVLTNTGVNRENKKTNF